MILRQKGVEEEPPPGRTHAFVAAWGPGTDEMLMAHWSGQHLVLPEYRRAVEQVCLDPLWMSNTKVLRHIRQISVDSFVELQALARDGGAVDRVARSMIQRAYGLSDPGAAHRQVDVISGAPIFENVKKCYNSLERWKQPYFVHACEVILKLEQDVGAIGAKLSEVVDRALHCRQVQVQAFQIMVSHSAHLLGRREQHVDDGSEAGFDAALRRFYECFEDFLDDYKERAFTSAFVEPARFYLVHSQAGPDFLKDNVDTHANNWYVSLLNAALGVHVPIMAAYWDDFVKPVCDYWAGLHDRAWERYFSRPEHFGRGWKGIPGLSREGRALIRRKVTTGTLPDEKVGHDGPLNVQMAPAVHFANSAVNPMGSAALRRRLAVYLERFASFFHREHFVRRAFEALNAECKPEHHGFRAALAELFAVYRQQNGDVQEETCVEHLYRDEMITEFDTERASRFFAWLCILKPGAVAREAGEAPAREAGQECPSVATEESNWCREAESNAVLDFLGYLRTEICCARSADDLADLMGRWQECEVMVSLPDLHTLAVLLLLDPALWEHLGGVLARNDTAFTQGSAGLWCRLFAMVLDAEIVVEAETAAGLKRLVDSAITSFEAGGAGGPENSGAMYMQLASAVLSASISGSSLRALVPLARRVGEACVRWHASPGDVARVRGHLPAEFVRGVSGLVWGGEANDVVLRAFFK